MPPKHLTLASLQNVVSDPSFVLSDAQMSDCLTCIERAIGRDMMAHNEDFWATIHFGNQEYDVNVCEKPEEEQTEPDALYDIILYGVKNNRTDTSVNLLSFEATSTIISNINHDTSLFN